MQHRDLKSANVLLVVVDGVLTAKVGDFGSASIKHRDTSNRSAKGGTTRWRTREIYDIPAIGKSPASPAAKYSEEADVWSFGMLVYEILTMLVRYFFHSQQS